MIPRTLLLLSLALVLVGCEPKAQVDPSLFGDLRKQFEMEPPEQTMNVRELRQQLADGSLPEGPVVIVGMVGGMPSPYEPDMQPHFPWVDGQAALFVVDESMKEIFKDHQHTDPDEQCAFCDRKAKQNADAVALVQFRGQDGKVLEYPAKELFALTESQTVTVKGKAQLMGNLLVVEADGVALASHASTPEKPVQTD